MPASSQEHFGDKRSLDRRCLYAPEPKVLLCYTLFHIVRMNTVILKIPLSVLYILDNQPSTVNRMPAD